jgi:U4/U6.U5 tri-snRNP-associated protein 2
VLPDGYEVKDPSLNDIKHVIYPTFTKTDLAEMDEKIEEAYDLNGKSYMPGKSLRSFYFQGYVGLNNMLRNDYINAVLQAFSHIQPLRDLFLLNDANPKYSELGLISFVRLISVASRFGLLLRKMWNRKAFKGHVSPHELIQVFWYV